ncbi:hypothetical protein HU200_061673 [Digitaria exilis]|uniref:F-box domain-containing protein n=1 Tax=Digitaria exilis TaxID=1010633 RepID=A0A835A7J0_9POAL|nr:hypothetical protein HU200_061673 [Digitaria exilis]
MADEGFDLLPTDTFVAILVRLPTSARRRSRLVCKRWRDVIDERTSERQLRTKILAFNSAWQSSHVVIFDDKDGRRRHDWTYDSALSGKVDMVGTSNGLICLQDTGDRDRSIITVANPITGEAMALPPLPRTWRPLTESPVWREVVSPAMSGSYNFFCGGVVCVDGSAYWFTLFADRVMALDLEDERFMSFPGRLGHRLLDVSASRRRPRGG